MKDKRHGILPPNKHIHIALKGVLVIAMEAGGIMM